VNRVDDVAEGDDVVDTMIARAISSCVQLFDLYEEEIKQIGARFEGGPDDPERAAAQARVCALIIEAKEVHSVFEYLIDFAERRDAERARLLAIGARNTHAAIAEYEHAETVALRRVCTQLEHDLTGGVAFGMALARASHEVTRNAGPRVAAARQRLERRIFGAAVGRATSRAAMRSRARARARRRRSAASRARSCGDDGDGEPAADCVRGGSWSR
jgi:hypothetical protein